VTRDKLRLAAGAGTVETRDVAATVFSDSMPLENEVTTVVGTIAQVQCYELCQFGAEGLRSATRILG
jgi:hypothetical protein